MDRIAGSDYRLDELDLFEWAHDEDIQWSPSFLISKETAEMEIPRESPIEAASIPALINIITGHCELDLNNLRWIQCCFLMSYHKNMNDLDLIRLLILRWKWTADDTEITIAEKLPKLLLISNFVRAWLNVKCVHNTCKFLIARWIKSIRLTQYQETIKGRIDASALSTALRQLHLDLRSCRYLLKKKMQHPSNIVTGMINNVRWIDPLILADASQNLDSSFASDSWDRRKQTLKHYLTRKARFTLRFDKAVFEDLPVSEEKDPLSVLLETPPDRLALHLSIVQEQVFASIPWGNVFDVESWAEIQDHSDSNHPVSKAIHRFNVISEWVSWCILLGHQQTNNSSRSRIVEFFFELASNLKRIFNYDTMMAVLIGIQHSAITRMKHSVWSGVSKKVRNQLSGRQDSCKPSSNVRLSDLCSPDKNWKNIRDLCNRFVIQPALAISLTGEPINLEQPPALAYFGLITSDLIFNEQAKHCIITDSDVEEVFMINVSKSYCRSRLVFRDFICGCLGIRGFLDVEHFYERARPSYASFYLMEDNRKFDKNLFEICDSIENKALKPLKQLAHQKYNENDLWMVSQLIEK